MTQQSPPVASHVRPINADDPIARSTDIVAANVDQLARLFPDAVTEDGIDFDVLRQLLGDDIDHSDEKFGLNWPGKRNARRAALTPSTGTLLPEKDKSVNWDSTQNIFIEGDNLEVLKLLQKSYAGKVDVIYIDPPYNTGKEFVYEDDFIDGMKPYLKLEQQISEDGTKLQANTDASGRKHSNWLSMIFPRLRLARNLLAVTGVLFVSIDDNELYYLKSVLDDVFGGENFLGLIVWKNVTDNNPSRIATEHEYVLSYARNAASAAPVWKMKANPAKMLLVEKGGELIAEYSSQDELQAAYTNWYRSNKSMLGPLADYKFIDRGGVYAGSRSVHNPGKEGYRYDVIHPDTGRPCIQPLMGYRFPKATMDELLAQDRIIFGSDETKLIELKIYARDYEEKLSSVYELDGRRGPNELKALMPERLKPFSNPKPVQLVSDLIAYAGPTDALVLDFFAGSGTTGQAVFEQNARDQGTRHFILVQLPEPLDGNDKSQADAAAFCDEIGRPRVISELTRERLCRAGAKATANPDASASDLDVGFRSFGLAETNIEAWSSSADSLEGDLLSAAENLKDDRTEDDILYELLLKLGLGLTTPVDTREVGGFKLHSVGYGTLFACLRRGIDLDAVEALGQAITDWHKEHGTEGEVTVVFRDSGFVDDVAKLNLAEILKQAGFPALRTI